MSGSEHLHHVVEALRLIHHNGEGLERSQIRQVALIAAEIIEQQLLGKERLAWSWSLESSHRSHGFATVYLHFDDRNRLLYVGETVRGNKRQREHKRSKPWYRFVAETRLVHVHGKDSSRALERLLVKVLRPELNVMMNEEEGVTREAVVDALVKAKEGSNIRGAINTLELADARGILLASEKRILKQLQSKSLLSDKVLESASRATISEALQDVESGRNIYSAISTLSVAYSKGILLASEKRLLDRLLREDRSSNTLDRSA